MRNGLVQLGAWAAATGAAVALSWLGVHAVLTGAAFEQPTAIPLPSAKADDPPPPATPTPDQRSAAPSTSPSPTTAPTTTAPHGPAPASTATPPGRRPAPTSAAAAATTATSTVKSYPVPGGKVALDLKDDRAALVSATPDPGWQMKVWNQDGWLRVDFVRGTEANSVIASWNGHAPIVETVVR
ncbi:hypothetical protein ACFRMQ_11265 [Kitasatospora sp. NPDC056783]|uniref:hypothetical protein n=1 Tax=Kitasatospora sp. NPDC056783 TaxID=3345943 RepID=UPI00367BCEAD